jgi:hypothetical protein
VSPVPLRAHVADRVPAAPVATVASVAAVAAAVPASATVASVAVAPVAAVPASAPASASVAVAVPAVALVVAGVSEAVSEGVGAAVVSGPAADRSNSPKPNGGKGKRRRKAEHKRAEKDGGDSLPPTSSLNALSNPNKVDRSKRLGVLKQVIGAMFNEHNRTEFGKAETNDMLQVMASQAHQGMRGVDPANEAGLVGVVLEAIKSIKSTPKGFKSIREQDLGSALKGLNIRALSILHPTAE